MKRPKFTTWERYQFAYLERQLNKKLSTFEKMAIVIHMGWRGGVERGEAVEI